MGCRAYAAGGYRLFEAYRQLRGEAGAIQIPGMRRALVITGSGRGYQSACSVILETAS